MKRFSLVLVVLGLLFVQEISCSGDSKHEGMRLIEFNETHRQWMSIAEVHKLASECAIHSSSFMDITDHRDLGTYSLHANPVIPTNPTQQAIVDVLTPKVSESNIRNTVIELSRYTTRYYTSQTGVTSANWLADLYRAYSDGRSDITVELFTHTWVQPSIIARIEGSGPNKNEIVVIGGHIDSISNVNTAPGADDDASGSAGVLEVFRVLAQNGFKPSKTIEFHGYAAEEVGLRGSQAIAESYVRQGKVIAGMMQLDMIGFYRAGTAPAITIITDHTSPVLSAFVRKLVTAYTSTPWTDETCGYACSDHASWTKAGYNACFPFEAKFNNENRQIHTINDVYTNLNFGHAAEFVRLAVGYAVEMSLFTG